MVLLSHFFNCLLCLFSNQDVELRTGHSDSVQKHWHYELYASCFRPSSNLVVHDCQWDWCPFHV